MTRFYITPVRHRLRLRRMPGGQACEASGSKSLRLGDRAGDVVASRAKGVFYEIPSLEKCFIENIRVDKTKVFIEKAKVLMLNKIKSYN